MHLGLYDIDLWHNARKTYPNLELAKVANYHRQKGDMVTMLTPKTDEGRFDKIIYFKERVSTIVPKTLILTGSKKNIYGQGFYQTFYPLDFVYYNMPPSYLIYEPFFDKLNTNFESLKRNSHIRIENRDLSGFKKEKTSIYVADQNYFDREDAFDFIEEFKNYKFNFIFGIQCRDPKQMELFDKYRVVFKNQLKIDFEYDGDFFKEYASNPKNVFPFLRNKENESDYHANLRAAAQGLYYLAIGRTENNYCYLKTPLGKKIGEWCSHKTSLSFADYFQSDKSVQLLIAAAPTDLRLMLKTSPQKINTSTFDFTGLL